MVEVSELCNLYISGIVTKVREFMAAWVEGTSVDHLKVFFTFDCGLESWRQLGVAAARHIVHISVWVLWETHVQALSQLVLKANSAATRT